MRLFGRTRKAARRPPAYSNESVIGRIERDGGVDRATARAWFDEMLVFLDLVAGSKAFISPPRPVDVAWHAFILHTRDYEAYCRERFGRVIHHQPTGEPEPDAYRRAYERRVQDGGVDGSIWPLPAGLAAGAVAAEASASESGTEGGPDAGGAAQGGGWFGGDGGGGGCGGGGG